MIFLTPNLSTLVNKAMVKVLTVFLLVVLCTFNLLGQVPEINTPQPANLLPNGTVGTTGNAGANTPNIPNMPNYTTGGKSIQQVNMEVIERDIREHEARMAAAKNVTENVNGASQWEMLNRKFTPLFDQAFDSITDMLDGKQPLDLKKALFLEENAFLGNSMDYNAYNNEIKDIVNTCFTYMLQQGMDVNDNMALNLALFQFMSDTLKIENVGQETVTETYPMKYDFEDYLGKTDWTKMFVSKLLATHSGQCHSLPQLYLAVAQEMGAKAYLSFSPMHSYVKIKDDKGQWYNVELTNGLFISDAAILESGFIKSEAIHSKIYMDTINLKETVAHTLYDLAKGSINRLGYNDVALKYVNKALEYFPNDVYAMQLKSDILTARAQYIGQQFRTQEEAESNPQYLKARAERNKAYQDVDNAGFEPMPDKFYESWLRSLQKEVNKQEHQKQYLQFRKMVRYK